MKTRSQLTKLPVALSALSLCIGALAACDDASKEDLRGPNAATTPLRVINLAVNLDAIDVCSGGKVLAEALAYGEAQPYRELSLGQTIQLVHSGAGCDETKGVEVTVDARPGWDDSMRVSLVLIGKAEGDLDSATEVEAVLIPDETEPSTMANTIKLRNFHADPFAPAIDVGVILPTNERLTLFEDVRYGNTPRGSDLSLSEWGFVDNVPIVPLPVRVWDRDGGAQVLQFDPFGGEPGGIYSVFPAGNVLTGQGEALLCADSGTDLSPSRANCQLFLGSPTASN